MRNFLVSLKAIEFLHSYTVCVGKFIKYLTEGQRTYFQTGDTLTVCEWSWFLCLISLLWIEILVSYLSGFLMKNIIISRIYKLGTLHICNFFNFSLQDGLCLNPSITLIILFRIISALCSWAPDNYPNLQQWQWHLLVHFRGQQTVS
jgi:hypothetical protein